MGIGGRLREERLRLGLSQEEFGDAGGVKKQAQLKYEKDERSPDGVYFSAVAAIGADVRFIITGQRDYEPPAPLSRDEQELLGLYRSAPLAFRMAAAAALASGSVSTHGERYRGATIGSVNQKRGTSVQQNFNGPVGQVVPGDNKKESGKK